jgi:hypothetical protein
LGRGISKAKVSRSIASSVSVVPPAVSCITTTCAICATTRWA